MLLDLPEDAALLSRSSSLDRSVSSSGRSFGRLACVATLVVGACCGALAVSSGHASWVTPTHAMGSSKHGAIHSSRMHGNITPKTTIQSAHVASSKPTVFVVSSVDPGKDESFEQFKADLLTQLDDPELIGRFEWSGTVSATQLPVHMRCTQRPQPSASTHATRDATVRAQSARCSPFGPCCALINAHLQHPHVLPGNKQHLFVHSEAFTPTIITLGSRLGLSVTGM